MFSEILTVLKNTFTEPRFHKFEAIVIDTETLNSLRTQHVGHLRKANPLFVESLSKFLPITLTAYGNKHYFVVVESMRHSYLIATFKDKTRVIEVPREVIDSNFMSESLFDAGFRLRSELAALGTSNKASAYIKEQRKVKKAQIRGIDKSLSLESKVNEMNLHIDVLRSKQRLSKFKNIMWGKK